MTTHLALLRASRRGGPSTVPRLEGVLASRSGTHDVLSLRVHNLQVAPPLFKNPGSAPEVTCKRSTASELLLECNEKHTVAVNQSIEHYEIDDCSDYHQESSPVVPRTSRETIRPHTSYTSLHLKKQFKIHKCSFDCRSFKTNCVP